MIHKIMVLLLFLLTGLHAQGDKWQELKTVNAYLPTEYHLKEGVEYLEIRNYFQGADDKKYDTKNYAVTVSMQKSALTSFGSDIVQKFKASRPNLSKQTDLKRIGFCLMSGCALNISNGFMIDELGKIWRMNKVEDVIEMLGEIDTPAEVKLVLWLNNEYVGISNNDHKYKYRKTTKGYTVISEYSNNLDNVGECGHFIYRIKMNTKGVITEEKLLKKEPQIGYCMTLD